MCGGTHKVVTDANFRMNYVPMPYDFLDIHQANVDISYGYNGISYGYNGSVPLQFSFRAGQARGSVRSCQATSS